MIARSVLPHRGKTVIAIYSQSPHTCGLPPALQEQNRMENKCNFNIWNLDVSTYFPPTTLKQHKRLNRCNTICHWSPELKDEGLKHCAQTNEIRADFIQNCIFSTQPYSYSSYLGCKVWLRISVPKKDFLQSRTQLWRWPVSKGRKTAVKK